MIRLYLGAALCIYIFVWLLMYFCWAIHVRGRYIYFIFYFGHATLGITLATIVFNFLYFFLSGIEFLTTPPPEGIAPSGFT